MEEDAEEEEVVEEEDASMEEDKTETGGNHSEYIMRTYKGEIYSDDKGGLL